MLRVTGLQYRYPGADVAALVDLGLTALRGEILGLLGPNGAGKSTLVAHLAGLLPVRQGAITLDDRPLAEARRDNPTRIAIAPQEYAFYPMLTVNENLACFAGACRLSGEAARLATAAALATTRLEQFARSRADRLSGGLKRRLNLAIALLARPELLVLDEPTVGVDPQSRAFILDTVRALAGEGMAIIYTSHYMEEIEAIADRVLILDHGRVLRQGTLDELLGQEVADLTVLLAKPLPAPLLAELGRFGRIDSDNDGAQLRVALSSPAAPGAMLAAIEAGGGEIREVRYGRRNLEQLFMSLTHTALRDN